MSQIHNLTSHLKNTTVTPAPPPQQNYRLTHNGLKIYQLVQNKDHQSQGQVQHQKLLYPPAEISGRKVSTNATFTPNANPPHNNFYPNQQPHLLQHLQQQAHQQQLLLNSKSSAHLMTSQSNVQHVHNRVPEPRSNFVNSVHAHQSSQPSRTGLNIKPHPPLPVNGGKNLTNHAVHNNHPTLTRQLSQPNFASPNKNICNNSSTGGINVKGNSSPITSFSKRTPNSNSNGQPQLTTANINSQVGGAARVQHNMVLSNNVQSPVQIQKPRNNTNSLDNIKNKAKIQGKKQVQQNNPNHIPSPIVVVKTEALSGVPSSEQVKRGPRHFQKGDDVLVTTDDGRFMFGTVGMIHGQTVQVLFGDGTQELASFDKVKLLTCAVEDDDDNTSSGSSLTNNNIDPSDNSSASSNHSLTSKSVNPTKMKKMPPSLSSPDQGQGKSMMPAGNVLTIFASEEVTCGSCGVVKKVAGKKALSYAPHTKNQFNCRRCLNKSRFSKNNIIPSAHRGKSSTSPNTSPSGKGSSNNGTGGSGGRGSLGSRGNSCFHCEKHTNYNDRLHCNLCERACHLSCLAMTPTPLEGDRFWDVICSSCGTQNGESGACGRTKVFSCRRSISSWSDVAHLVLSCLSSQPEHLGERFFDLDNDVIPFIDNNLDRLHLPRAYKNVVPENRKIFLNTALNNATLRFLNGKDVSRKTTLWSVRESNSHQGYPSLRMQLSPQKTVRTAVNGVTVGTTPTRPVRSVTLTDNNNSNAGSPTKTTTSPSTPKTKSQDASTAAIQGGSSRTLGTSPHSLRSSPKNKFAVTNNDIEGSPKGKLKIVSQTVRLLQKAKKQLDSSSNKRKPTCSAGDIDNSSSPVSKRLKLTPAKESTSPTRNGLNGMCTTPLKLPAQNGKQVADWIVNLNAGSGSAKKTSSPATPSSAHKISKSEKGTPFSEISPMFGRAVKSAGITPPGTSSKTSEKPSLRIRKPKALDLKLKEEDNKVSKKSENSGGLQQKTFGKLRGRGRPLGSKLSNAALQKFIRIPMSNGAVPADEDIEQEPGEFSVLASTVEDLVIHGQGYTLHCLPKPPETEPEKKALLKKVAEAYASETVATPSYLNHIIANNNGAKLKSRGKSKRDLNDWDSYQVIGKWIDHSGKVRYYCEWKDGHCHNGSGEDFEGLEEMEVDKDDADNAQVLFEIGESIKEEKLEVQNIPSCVTDTSSNGTEDISIIEPEKNEPTSNPVKADSKIVHLNPLFINGIGQSQKEEDDNILIDLTSDSP